MGGFAWVTLATNDSYSLGALVLAHSLKQTGTPHSLVVLITPGVTNAMREKLASVFNVVQEVNILDSRDESNLRLLKRPELGITFTKLHCWRLTQFDKCVFLDADTLVLQNCDELFDREELSAAPDVGWPDCFNSGVFVYRPSNETYEKLIEFALEKGSFDGGDQGLLNLYFSDWATKDISKHLPFIYNLSSTATYSYLPAFKQFGINAKIIHFIGATKPWLQYFNTESRKVQPNQDLQHLEGILQHWWNIFCALIHPNLTPEMSGLAGAFAQLTLGAARTAEQTALDDHLRRQGWESGNIDYMGRDSFDNIWSKICETLSAALPTEAPTSIEATIAPTSGTTLTEEREAISETLPEQEGLKSELTSFLSAETKSVSEAKPSSEESKVSSESQSSAKTESSDQVVRPDSEAPALKTEAPQCPLQAKPKEETISAGSTQSSPSLQTKQDVQTESSTSKPESPPQESTKPEVPQDIASPPQEILAQPKEISSADTQHLQQEPGLLPTETASPVDVCTKPSEQSQSNQVVPQTSKPTPDVSAQPQAETPQVISTTSVESPSKLSEDIEPKQTTSESQPVVSPPTAISKKQGSVPSQDPPSSTTQEAQEPSPVPSTIQVSPTTPVLSTSQPSTETSSVPPETLPSSTQPSTETPSVAASTPLPSTGTVAIPSETTPVSGQPSAATTAALSETTPASAQPSAEIPSVTSPPPQPSTEASIVSSETPLSTPPTTEAPSLVSSPPQPSTEIPSVISPPQSATGTSTVSTEIPPPAQPTAPVVSSTAPAKIQPVKSENTSATTASVSPTEQTKKSSDAKPEATTASSVASPTPPPRKTGGGKKSKSKK